MGFEQDKRERENNLPEKERSLFGNTHTHTHTHTRESNVPIVAKAVRNHPVDNEPDGATPVAKLLKPWILRVKARHRVFHMLQPCTEILYKSGCLLPCCHAYFFPPQHNQE
jgi:hypothetical protein